MKTFKAFIIFSVLAISFPAYAQREYKDSKNNEHEQRQNKNFEQNHREQKEFRNEHKENAWGIKREERIDRQENKRVEKIERRDNRREEKQNEVQSRVRNREVLITRQQVRIGQYRNNLDHQVSIGLQHSRELQSQRRSSQFIFHEQYLARIREQNERLRVRVFDFDRDPFFNARPSFRYFREGVWFEVNTYQQDLLRQAVDYGYSQGFLAGRADREDQWAYDYQGCYAYIDANYGYSGLYIEQGDYNFYFREGFRRGYEDGYNNRLRYGRYVNGRYAISINVTSAIFHFQLIN